MRAAPHTAIPDGLHNAMSNPLRTFLGIWVGAMVSRFSDKDILLGDAACLFIAGALAGLSIWGIARERNVAIGVHADNTQA